jgi:hypothetical protein
LRAAKDAKIRAQEKLQIPMILFFLYPMQEQLESAYAAKLDVEDTCRAFLELAKLCGNSVVAIIFHDDGMVEQFKRLYVHTEWLSGTTTQTILVTIAGEGLPLRLVYK